MATLLRLKVSENEYKEAISQLGTKLTELEGCLHDLQAKRGEIQGGKYEGEQGRKAIDAIMAYEAQLQTNIDKVRDQKAKIESYLTTMNTVDSEIKQGYDDSIREAQRIFD